MEPDTPLEIMLTISISRRAPDPFSHFLIIQSQGVRRYFFMLLLTLLPEKVRSTPVNSEFQRACLAVPHQWCTTEARNFIQTMKSVVAQPRADQPRVVFVVLSVSELCVSLEGDFLSKMQSVEMFVVCSDSYAAPEALGFTALCGAPGMKVSTCVVCSDQMARNLHGKRHCCGSLLA